MPRLVVLLRAISNVAMQPYRKRMEALGFSDVESVGMSGNLIFSASRLDAAVLERRISAGLGTAAFVRSRRELTAVTSSDPLQSGILFLARAPTTGRRRRFREMDLATPRPVLRGRTVYFVYPARLRGKRSPLDLEAVLGVPGTMRSARVISQLLARM
jgi:uncharacterized protein (DUF1697 family)